MGTSAANIAIENLFKTGWGSTTAVKYDNVPLTTYPTTAWVGLEVWDGKSGQASLNTSTGATTVALRRATGTVFINIYTPLNKGSKAARDLADTACAIFRSKQVSGITFEEPSVRRVGEQYFSINGVQSTTQWYQLIVSVPYFYDVVI